MKSKINPLKWSSINNYVDSHRGDFVSNLNISLNLEDYEISVVRKTEKKNALNVLPSLIIIKNSNFQ